MDKDKWIEGEVVSAINMFAGLLPEDEVTHFRWVAREECGIAFEGFCEQLYEHQVRLDSTMLSQLRTLGARLGINERFIAPLSQLLDTSGSS